MLLALKMVSVKYTCSSCVIYFMRSIRPTRIQVEDIILFGKPCFLANFPFSSPYTPALHHLRAPSR